MKFLIIFLKKTEYLSSVSIRLVRLTRKSKVPIHPKHLIKKENTWFSKYLNTDDNMLDIGCGEGFDLMRSSKLVKSAFGIDINEKSLSIAKKLTKYKKIHNIKFLLADANLKLPFKKKQFDKVICSDVLEHLEKSNFALREIKRVLKKNGLLFLVTDNPQTRWKKIQARYGLPYFADPDHKHEYTQKEIVNILESKGFMVISLEPITYDSPFKGFIDLTGGISLKVYKYLSKRKQNLLKKFPEDTTGFKIIAKKVK